MGKATSKMDNTNYHIDLGQWATIMNVVKQRNIRIYDATPDISMERLKQEYKMVPHGVYCIVNDSDYNKDVVVTVWGMLKSKFLPNHHTINQVLTAVNRQ